MLWKNDEDEKIGVWKKIREDERGIYCWRKDWKGGWEGKRGVGNNELRRDGRDLNRI